MSFQTSDMLPLTVEYTYMYLLENILWIQCNTKVTDKIFCIFYKPTKVLHCQTVHHLLSLPPEFIYIYIYIYIYNTHTAFSVRPLGAISRTLHLIRKVG
jgi:hypothetical protein